MSKRLSPLDLAFVQMESATNPVHVAGLQIYEKPADYDGHFERDLYEQFLTRTKATPPFNHILRMPFLPVDFPRWEEDAHFDIEYHVRHNALPSPGGMDELMKLVARLHARLLDRARPLWELYIIEGLGDNKFAIYTKMHHAAIDGVAGMRLMNKSLQDSPDERPEKFLWELERGEKANAATEKTVKDLAGEGSGLMMMARAVPEVYRTLLEHGLQNVGLLNKPSGAMFQAPKSVLNVKVSGGRRVAVRSLPLSQIKAMGKKVGASLNDMIMLICAGALKQYLAGRGDLPEKPLLGSMPVSVAPAGDERKSGNQISYIMSPLGTDKESLAERLMIILDATRQAKQDVLEMSTEGAKAIAMLGNSLTAVMKQLRLVNLAPPPANLIISNVPGPLHSKYFMGAKLLANYPMSVLVDGQALNITITSYEDQLDFGLVSCREAFPDLDDLQQAIGDAWADIDSWLQDDSKAEAFVHDLAASRAAHAEEQELVSDFAKMATRSAEYASKSVIEGAAVGAGAAGKAGKVIGRQARRVGRQASKTARAVTTGNSKPAGKSAEKAAAAPPTSVKTRRKSPTTRRKVKPAEPVAASSDTKTAAGKTAPAPAKRRRAAPPKRKTSE